MARSNRRKSFRDKSTVGRSAIVPFIRGESSKQRHRRRKRSNLEIFEAIKNEFDLLKLSVEIKNDGHHWIIRNEDQSLLCEFWPSSAKLVFEMEYKNGIHCHDATQVLQIIRNRNK